MGKSRVAFVGLGNYSNALAGSVERAENLEIVNCFTRTAATREAFAEKHGCRESNSLDGVLNDSEVEGVIVVTPHSTHADIICQAASAGKHVFIEKPLALTVADVDRASDAASKAGVTLQVGHHRRFQGATRHIRQMIDSGELGVLYQLEANLSMPGGPRTGWRDDPNECPVGSMTGLGVHMVDNLHYLAGPVKQVSAFSAKLTSVGNLDNVTSIVAEFESGALGYIGTCSGVPKLFSTAAFGTECNAWCEDEGKKLFLQKKGEMVRAEVPVEGGDAIAEELAAFGNSIRTRVRAEVGGPEGREVIVFLEAVIESVKSGKAVDLSNYRG